MELKLKDGRELAHHTRAVRGTPENPMTRAEVEAKALDLLAPVVGRRRSAALCAAIWGVEKIRDVRSIRRLLQT